MKEKNRTGDKDLLSLLSEFRDKKIAVYGDMMLDKYIWGEVSRISPEAPVQVVHVSRETFAPGGACNVAANAAALGASVRMVGLSGMDDAGNRLKTDLQRLGINVDGAIQDSSRSTIQKVRIVGKGQQLLRVDYEMKEDLTSLLEMSILNQLESTIDQADAIIISDYAKGVVTRNICARLIQWTNQTGKALVIDPKPKHRDFYANSTVVTPNLSELRKMAGIDEDQDCNVQQIGASLAQSLSTNLLITLGEKGMCLCEKNGELTHIPARSREVYSLVGAGDTVVACLALALASGAGILDSARIANIAAGIKVAKVGTATVTLAEIRHEIEHEDSA